jgi:hypothetical protein
VDVVEAPFVAKNPAKNDDSSPGGGEAFSCAIGGAEDWSDGFKSILSRLDDAFDVWLVAP